MSFLLISKRWLMDWFHQSDFYLNNLSVFRISQMYLFSHLRWPSLIIWPWPSDWTHRLPQGHSYSSHYNGHLTDILVIIICSLTHLNVIMWLSLVEVGLLNHYCKMSGRTSLRNNAWLYFFSFLLYFLYTTCIFW